MIDHFLPLSGLVLFSLSLLKPIPTGDEFSFRAGEDFGDIVGEAKILRA